MTNLVARLRANTRPICIEAADEIERLRTEIGELTKGPEWENVYQETIGELRAELEQLRALLKLHEANR